MIHLLTKYQVRRSVTKISTRLTTAKLQTDRASAFVLQKFFRQGRGCGLCCNNFSWCRADPWAEKDPIFAPLCDIVICMGAVKKEGKRRNEWTIFTIVYDCGQFLLEKTLFPRWAAGAYRHLRRGTESRVLSNVMIKRENMKSPTQLLHGNNVH